MSAPGPTIESPAGRLPATFRALRHGNYRLYFVGQIVSLVGTFFQITALNWLVTELTGESRWPAVMTAVQLLPGFFLGPLTGALADRWPKRTIILGTQAAFCVVALAMALLVLSGNATPWNLLGLATVNGLVGALDLPARLTFVMELVGREDIVNAVALNSLLFNVARALGPALAGLLMTWISPGVCFLVNSLSYLAVLGALAAMKLPAAPSTTPRRTEITWYGGFHALTARPRLAILVAMAGVLAFTGWPFLVLMPLLAVRRLGMQSLGYGMLVSATGVGALLSAVAVATFGSLARRRFFITVGVALAVVGLLGLSQADEMIEACVCCALIGSGMIMFFATGQAVVQLSTDDHVRGRVLGIWSMMVMGGQPLGSLLAGTVADALGPEGPSRVLVGQGVLCGTLAVALFGLWFCFRPSPSHRPAPASQPKEES